MLAFLTFSTCFRAILRNVVENFKFWVISHFGVKLESRLYDVLFLNILLIKVGKFQWKVVASVAHRLPVWQLDRLTALGDCWHWSLNSTLFIQLITGDTMIQDKGKKPRFLTGWLLVFFLSSLLYCWITENSWEWNAQFFASNASIFYFKMADLELSLCCGIIML